MTLNSLMPALIASVIALLTLVINKENKLTDYRKDWVSLFSHNVSIFIQNLIQRNESLKKVHTLRMESHLINEHKDYDKPQTKRQNEIDDAIKQNLERAYQHNSEIIKSEASIRIALSSTSLIKSTEIEDFLTALSKSEKLEMTTKSEDIAMMICNKTCEINKKQWMKIKDGEVIYKITKFTFLIIAISAPVIYVINALFNL